MPVTWARLCAALEQRCGPQEVRARHSVKLEVERFLTGRQIRVLRSLTPLFGSDDSGSMTQLLELERGGDSSFHELLERPPPRGSRPWKEHSENWSTYRASVERCKDKLSDKWRIRGSALPLFQPWFDIYVHGDETVWLAERLDEAQRMEFVHWFVNSRGEREENACGGFELLAKFPSEVLFRHMTAQFGDLTDHQNKTKLEKTLKSLGKKAKEESWIIPAIERLVASNKTIAAQKRFYARHLERMRFEVSRGKVKRPSASESTEESLLKVIGENRNEVSPLMVYADWLLEAGNRWGEVIQLALKVKQHRDSKQENLLKALEKKHARKWLAPIRRYLRMWYFREGLLGGVSADVSDFLEISDAIALRTPGGTLQLTRLRKRDLPGLTNAPLNRFKTVVLQNIGLGDKEMVELTRSKHGSGVQRWDFDYNRFSSIGLKALGSSSFLSETTHLSLLCSHRDERTETTTGLSGDDLVWLMKDAKVPRLKWLDIGLLSLTRAQVTALCGLSKMRRLTHLRIIRQQRHDPLSVSFEAVALGFVPLLERCPELTVWFSDSVDPDAHERLRISERSYFDRSGSGFEGSKFDLDVV